MSEPTTQATEIETVRPDLLHWWVHDDRIDNRSDAWAVIHDGRLVLIDPLPMDEAVVGRTTGDPQVTAFVERFAAMGAPWHCGIDDLPALAREAGLAVADVAKVAELHRTFWPDKPMESVMYDHYALCTLKPA